MEQFGRILAGLRQDHKMTQRELGKIIFVSTGTISNYEKGVHYPDVEKLTGLADYFNVTTDYLLGRCASRQSPDVLKQLVAEGKTVGELVQELIQLPVDRKQALLLIVRDMELGSMLNRYNMGDQR